MQKLGIKRCIITPICRENRGNIGAIDEALSRIREQYIQTLHSYEDEKYVTNFIVTLELQFEQRNEDDK